MLRIATSDIESGKERNAYWTLERCGEEDDFVRDENIVWRRLRGGVSGHSKQG